MRRLVLLLVSCGDPDPCEDITGTCLVVEIESESIDRVDQLELDVLYGGFHGTTTTRASGGGVVTLPLTTAVVLDVATTEPLRIGVVAAGKLAGTVRGTGAASAVLEPGAHPTVTIELAPAEPCVAGDLHCGGDMLAGDPNTLYQCNSGGVPLARGACTAGCVVRPNDDTCRGTPGTCVDGGFYCGGDKLDGDPQTLYRCSAGVGVAGVVCADGCIVAPPGMDDLCR